MGSPRQGSLGAFQGKIVKNKGGTAKLRSPRSRCAAVWGPPGFLFRLDEEDDA